MKKFIPHILGAIFVLIIIGAWMLIAHLVKKPNDTQVPFVVAHNYFVRNDAIEPIPAKIVSLDEFEQYFGMAAFMGKNGQPTPIDFEKQFAIAVVLPETNHSTELYAASLTDDGKKLIFTYRVDVAPKENTWTQVPMLLIFVDRQYERNSVELQSNFVTDISGTWQVRAFDNIMLTEDSVSFPTISLLENGVITASAGCNGMGGNYQYANGRLIIKDGMCQTEVWCENEQMMRNERLLAQTLHDTLAVTALSADSVLVQGTHTMIIVR